MDFAPYQDTEPASTRALSPPPNNNRTLSPSRKPASPSPQSRPNDLPPPSAFGHRSQGFGNTDDDGRGLEDGRMDVNLFETSLPLRLDYEAMLAYLALPPAGGVFLLVMEHRSDYVRFHAWQSSLLFSAIFVLHLILSWSSILSWLLFVVDLGLIGLLTFKAYRDADGLDRFEVPFFGGLASSFVDSE